MKKALHRLIRLALLPVGFGFIGSAGAHITLETPRAEAGAYYKAVFRVSHGCQGSPVKQIIVELPTGVQGAKPMPKAGWQLDIERAKLDQPYSSHGKTVAEDVSRLSWRGGPLPDDQYDEFVLFARLPERSGPLYWKVSQICETGRMDWADIPADGRKLSDSKTPAVLLELAPKVTAEHVH